MHLRLERTERSLRDQLLLDDHSRGIYLLNGCMKGDAERRTGQMLCVEKVSKHPFNLTGHVASLKFMSGKAGKGSSKELFLCVHT